MTAIHLYASGEATGTVLCGSNTVGAAIRLDKLTLFSADEICRECMAKANELRPNASRE